MGEPGGLPSTGLHRVGHNCSDLAAAAAASGWALIQYVFLKKGKLGNWSREKTV